MAIYKYREAHLSRNAVKYVYTQPTKYAELQVKESDYINDLLETEVRGPDYDKQHNVVEWDDNHKSYTYGAYRKKPYLVKQTDT